MKRIGYCGKSRMPITVSSMLIVRLLAGVLEHSVGGKALKSWGARI